jgi:hypothetical protein
MRAGAVARRDWMFSPEAGRREATMTKSTDKFSGGLGKTMAALYKVGGLMLVLVFLGASLLFAGNFSHGAFPGAIVAIGAVLTFACLGLYAWAQKQATDATRKTREFSDQLAGDWWELVTPVHGTAVSWIIIRTHPVTGMVVLNGRAYDNDGVAFAKWDSVASSVDADNAKVFYHWRGYQIEAPQRNYEGFGEITFDTAGKLARTGDGKFFDARLDANTFVTKSFHLRRMPEADAKLLNEGADRAAIVARIQEMLK